VGGEGGRWRGGGGASLSAVRKLNTLHNQNLNKMKKGKEKGTLFLHFTHSKKKKKKSTSF